MVPPILGDMIVRRIVVTIVVAGMKVSLTRKKIGTTQKNVKTMRYSSMTAVAANATATTAATPYAAAHVVLVRDGEVNHEH